MTGIIRSFELLAQLYALYAARRAVLCRNPVLRRAYPIRWLMWVSVLVYGLYGLLAHPSTAAAFSLFDPLVNTTQTQSFGWFNSIQGMVQTTFTLLGTIEICWAAAIWAFEKDSLNSLTVEVIKKLMFIGFFYTLLQYAGSWIPAIMQTFEFVGTTAAGLDTTISTDSIIGDGLSLAGKLFGASIAIAVPLWAIPEEEAGFTIPGVEIGYMTADCEMILCIIVCIAVVIAYVIVAAQFFTAKVESYVLFAAGAIFLGLGSNSFTKEYTSKYISYAIHAGMRMLVLILILSITLNSVKSVGTPPGLDIPGMLTLLAAAVLQAILAMRAPDMASALMSGGGIGLSAGSALGAARGAVTAEMGAIAKIASAGQGASNLGKAVQAGHKLQQDDGKSGAAAMLGGLRAVAGEVAKAAPGHLMSSIKRHGQGGIFGAGQNPGGFGAGQNSSGSGGSQNSGGSGAGQNSSVSGGSQNSGASGAGQGVGSVRGQNPGVFDVANRNLRARLDEARNGQGQPPPAPPAASTAQMQGSADAGGGGLDNTGAGNLDNSGGAGLTNTGGGLDNTGAGGLDNSGGAGLANTGGGLDNTGGGLDNTGARGLDNSGGAGSTNTGGGGAAHSGGGSGPSGSAASWGPGPPPPYSPGSRPPPYDSVVAAGRDRSRLPARPAGGTPERTGPVRTPRATPSRDGQS